MSLSLILDAKGDTLWTWRRTAFGYSKGYSILATSDDGCVVVYGGKVVKLSADGIVLDETGNIFGGATNANIISAYDGGYLLRVMTYSPHAYTPSGYTVIFKLSDELEVTWKREYTDVYEGVVKLMNGGYALARRTYYPEPPDYSFALIGNDGNVIHTYNYGDSDTESAHDVYEARDSGFLLAGAFEWGPRSHAYLIRTDAFGEILWEKEFHNGTYDRIEKVIELNNHEIVLLKTGYEEITESNTSPGKSYYYSKQKVYVIRLTEHGDVRFQKEYAVSDGSWFSGARLAESSNGYVIFMAFNNKFLVSTFLE